MNEQDYTELGLDTFSNFGKDFQIKAIAAFLTDRAFFERIFEILQPEFFDQDAHQWVVKKLMSYFQEFKLPINKENLQVEITKVTDEILKAAIITECSKVFKKLDADDFEYIKKEILEFCKHQKMKSAIAESLALLKNKDFETIRSKFDDALKAGMERDLGHDYNNDIEARMAASCRETVKTNWKEIDLLLDGGLGKGELGFIVAPAGIGKTWQLIKLGTEALKQGKNVVHFTMELNQNYVGLRYDACFSKIQFQDVRNQRAKIDAAVKEHNKGRLFVKYYPLKTITANTLKVYVERLQLVTGIKIDLIIVDYADLLKPLVTNKNSNSYADGGAVYEELRAVAGELQIPCWSASQAQRAMAEEEVIGASGVADSYRKIMTGDFILSLSRMVEDKTAGTARIHVIKNRFGADGMTFQCNFDTSCGNIEIFESNTVEGLAIINRTKGQKDNIKKIIRNRLKTQEPEE